MNLTVTRAQGTSTALFNPTLTVMKELVGSLATDKGEANKTVLNTCYAAIKTRSKFRL